MFDNLKGIPGED